MTDNDFRLRAEIVAIQICAMYQVPLRLALPQFGSWSNATRRRMNKLRAVLAQRYRKDDR